MNTRHIIIAALTLFFGHIHAGNLKKMSEAIYKANLADVKILIHSKQVSVEDRIPCHSLTGGSTISYDSLLGRAVEIYALNKNNALEGDKGYDTKEVDSRDIVLFLLKMKAPLNMLSEWKHLAPLHRAAIKNMPDVVTWLLDHGADINLPGGSSTESLSHALNRGIDPFDSKYKPKITLLHETPLYFATQFNNPLVVKILLDRGAKIELTNTYGLTPYDLTTSHDSSKNDFFASREVKTLRDDIQRLKIYSERRTVCIKLYRSNIVIQNVPLTTQDRAEIKKIFDDYVMRKSLQKVLVAEKEKPTQSTQNVHFCFQ